MDESHILQAESRAVSSYLRAESGGWHPRVVFIGNGVLRFPSLELDMTLDEIYELSTFAGLG